MKRASKGEEEKGREAVHELRRTVAASLQVNLILAGSSSPLKYLDRNTVSDFLTGKLFGRKRISFDLDYDEIEKKREGICYSGRKGRKEEEDDEEEEEEEDHDDQNNNDDDDDADDDEDMAMAV
ncbi:hypothetical protein V1478_004622 [Vespula squamosa]|uniref:Uncharacterized protein n=1 Tax=Vespula squamosa TaxID=30214 RepID=A0ABD2BGQ2_VESSQ